MLPLPAFLVDASINTRKYADCVSVDVLHNGEVFGMVIVTFYARGSIPGISSFYINFRECLGIEQVEEKGVFLESISYGGPNWCIDPIKFNS